MTRSELPELPHIAQWALPLGPGMRSGPGGEPNLTVSMLSRATFGDCKHAPEEEYRLFARPASGIEQDAAVGLGTAPMFSACTLPVVIAVDWPYMLVSSFVPGAVAVADSLLASGAIDRSATLAMLTPGGLGLAPVQEQLLQRLSDRPVLTWRELGRLRADGPVAWSGEGERVHCFEKMLMCSGAPQNASHGALAAGAAVGPAMATEAAEADPADFGGPRPAREDPKAGAAAGKGLVLRVLFEARKGPVRRILNLPELLRACEEASKKGFTSGPFSSVACRTHDFDPDDMDTLVSPEQFRANIAAVRSAHVLVAVHGEASAYGIFMRQYGGVSASAIAAAAAADQDADEGTRQLRLLRRQRDSSVDDGSERRLRRLLHRSSGRGEKAAAQQPTSNADNVDQEEAAAAAEEEEDDDGRSDYDRLIAGEGAGGGTRAFALGRETETGGTGGGGPGGSMGGVLLQLRPCRYGTAFTKNAEKGLAKMFAHGGPAAPVLVAYNVEDPAQCSKSELQAEAERLRAEWQRQQHPSSQEPSADAPSPHEERRGPDLLDPAEGDQGDEDEAPGREHSQAAGSSVTLRRSQGSDADGTAIKHNTRVQLRRQLSHLPASEATASAGAAAPEAAAAGVYAAATRRVLRPKGFDGYLDGANVARDQHLTLNATQLMEVLRTVALWVADRSAAEGAGLQGRGHAYALAGGRVAWADSGVADLTGLALAAEAVQN
ncbi:hypothetical protein HYH03_007760 [Edaphochlamys debaryana]|uniref:Uncharacterized protein n=1 Tax=Edaphochlamys debaryana TaxID=47281 RepID=A0A835Y2R1_9CHLO|nr:hypothetical protein HYH03_007760 [Edaphochlamys debaryana]|eukprot:KAG2494122.1 hypothetical protein HYH03_007760 [Edaphochlamys debaryana]